MGNKTQKASRKPPCAKNKRNSLVFGAQEREVELDGADRKSREEPIQVTPPLGCSTYAMAGHLGLEMWTTAWWLQCNHGLPLRLTVRFPAASPHFLSELNKKSALAYRQNARPEQFKVEELKESVESIDRPLAWRLAAAAWPGSGRGRMTTNAEGVGSSLYTLRYTKGC